MQPGTEYSPLLRPIAPSTVASSLARRGTRYSPPAFWFVLKGIPHLLLHLHLYPPVIKRIPQLLLLSIAVLAFLFIFTYLPQVAFLAFFHGPLAWFNAAVMVLNEAALIISFLAEAWLVEEGPVDLFDAVLIDHGHASLVMTAREIDWNGTTSVKKLGKFTKSPYLRFSLRLTCEFLLLFPVNFIPVVGPALFIVLQGYRAGPLSHYRYFQLKGLKKSEQKRWVRSNVWSYVSFGTLHLTLQIIPLLSILFLFTSAVGSALWAVELERRAQEASEEPSTPHICSPPHVQNQPPQYQASYPPHPQPYLQSSEAPTLISSDQPGSTANSGPRSGTGKKLTKSKNKDHMNTSKHKSWWNFGAKKSEPN